MADGASHGAGVANGAANGATHAGDAHAQADAHAALVKENEALMEKVQSLRTQRNEAYQWVEDMQRDGQAQHLEELEEKVASLRKQRNDAYEWIERRKLDDEQPAVDAKRLAALEAANELLQQQLNSTTATAAADGSAGSCVGELANDSHLDVAALSDDARQFKARVDTLEAQNKALEAQVAAMMKDRAEAYIAARKYHRRAVAGDGEGADAYDSPQRSPCGKDLVREYSVSGVDGAQQKLEAVIVALGDEAAGQRREKERCRQRLDHQRESANTKITMLNNRVAELQLKLDTAIRQLHERNSDDDSDAGSAQGTVKVAACCRREVAKVTKSMQDLRVVLEATRACVHERTQERDEARRELAAERSSAHHQAGNAWNAKGRKISTFTALFKRGRNTDDDGPGGADRRLGSDKLLASSVGGGSSDKDHSAKYSDPCSARAEVDELRRQVNQLETRVQVKDFKIKRLKQQRTESRDHVEQLRGKERVLHETVTQEVGATTVQNKALILHVKELEVKVATLRKQRNEALEAAERYRVESQLSN